MFIDGCLAVYAADESAGDRGWTMRLVASVINLRGDWAHTLTIDGDRVETLTIDYSLHAPGSRGSSWPRLEDLPQLRLNDAFGIPPRSCNDDSAKEGTVGKRSSTIDATGTTTYGYDELNRLTSVLTPSGQTIGYTYDEVGNLMTITTAFGVVEYTYDDLNRLSTLTLPGGAQVTYQYDGSGNLMGVQYPNSTYATYSYDLRNRLTILINGKDPGVIISEYTYTLDGVGNRVNVAYTEPLSRPYTLGDVSYTYLTGNRLQAAGAATYGYDNNGNTTTKTVGGNQTTYTYDALNRLTQVTSPSPTIQYQYDGLGNRVAKIVGGTTTRYLVDPNGALPQVIGELDGAGNFLAYYVYDPWGLVAKISSGSTYFYHFDGLGSTIAMTNPAGSIVNKYAYDEYGNVLNQVEAVSNPFKYVGRYGVMSDDTGLLYMRARYYDPETGRFISKDPIRFRGRDWNLYAYVDSVGKAGMGLSCPFVRRLSGKTLRDHRGERRMP